jgi:hypothetical protein
LRDKLSPQRLRVRLLGYGKDDTYDQFHGFRVLVQDPKYRGKIEEEPIVSLVGYQKEEMEDLYQPPVDCNSSYDTPESNDVGSGSDYIPSMSEAKNTGSDKSTSKTSSWSTSDVFMHFPSPEPVFLNRNEPLQQGLTE